MDKKTPFYIGAYATSPCIYQWNAEKEASYLKLMAPLVDQVNGLEMPYWGGGAIHPQDQDFYDKYYHAQWSFVMTLIPGNMKCLAIDPFFGLASDSGSGRKKALEYYKEAHSVFLKLTRGSEKRNIPYVQIVSSPSYPVKDVKRSSESFYRSLQEVLSWDWGSTKIRIEHCDSAFQDGSFQKGFLPIEEEIDVILKLKDERNDLGLVLNWGRSAIEYQSKEGPIRHIEMAQSNGILRGFIFSGVIGDNVEYGNWKDLHAPLAADYDGVSICPQSLLTIDEVLRVANILDMSKLNYLGMKILVSPPDEVAMEFRIDANRRMKDALFEVFKNYLQ